jgi:hypothetical protein
MHGTLRGGASTAYTDQIVITHQGAAYVTHVTVACQPSS